MFLVTSSHARVELLSQPSGGGYRRHRINPSAVAGRPLCGRVVLRRRALTPGPVAAGRRRRRRRRVVIVDVARVAVEQLEVSGETVAVVGSEVRFARTAQGLVRPDAGHRFPVDVLDDLFSRRSGGGGGGDARWRCGVGKEARLQRRVPDDAAMRRNHVIFGGT